MSFPEPGRVLGQVLTKRNAVSGDAELPRERFHMGRGKSEPPVHDPNDFTIRRV